MALAALLLIALLAPKTFSSGGEAQLDALIAALQRAAAHLQSNYQGYNFDGLVGFRFLNDWIHGVLKKWEANLMMHFQWQQLAQLERTVSSLIERTMNVLKQTDEVYYTDFKELLNDGFWKTPSSWSQTDPTLAYHEFNKAECLDKTLSNVCIIHTLGTGLAVASACSVPTYCKDTMTQAGCSNYSLSHQLFYFMIASQKGCQDHLIKVETEVYSKIFCANMMKINQKIEQDGFPLENQDLFLENIMFCAMSGFSDFLKPSWLERILTWQDPESGCFGKIGVQKEIVDKTAQEKHRGHRRVKRREKRLTDGCLCHKTSVAVGALGAFLCLF